MKALFIALFVSSSFLAAEDYSLGPDSQPQPGVPKGVVTKYKLEPGKFYPGTPHNYSVYVPAQYDASKPTAFMIYMDGSGAIGNGQRVPVVFDNLIAKHDTPPMIGIFVDPGVLPPVSSSAQSRFERVFEYDSMSTRFANFLLQELIPEVAKKYNLSKNPDDRGLAGVSTGAVGAFMAAWNRPDQFHRVLSFIGTYVAMKGADALPALIRKSEPKPIRFFLQDGKNDHLVPGQPYGTFYAGSWPINNQVMFEALQYAGYDAKLVIGDGGHDMKQGSAIMPDALRWLWREYPKPITVHEPAQMTMTGWDPRAKVYSTVWADKGWEPVNEKAPVADRAATAKGGVYFTEPGKKTVSYKNEKGETRVVYNGGELSMPSGVALSPDQAMLIVTDAQSRYSWSFQIAGNGSLVNGEPFYRLEMPEETGMSGVKGAAEDTLGQVYFATPIGIQVCEANGRVAQILSPPDLFSAVTSVAFGGKDLNFLYATSVGKVYRRPVKVTGAAASSPVQLPKPPL